MTPTDQQIAIAKACGWKRAPEFDIPHALEGPRYFYRKDNVLIEQSVLLDYLNDLNAMHEAWQTLIPADHKLFRFHLQAIVQRDGILPGYNVQSVCNATAAQRAEAFLRTIGEWKE